MKIIDANGLILGRLASNVAKLALNGETVNVINCEKAVISGKPKMIVLSWKVKLDRTTPFHGPFYNLMPDRFVKRVIRGMLPKKRWSEKSRGRLAYSRIKCYIGVPQELKGKESQTIDAITATNLKTPHRITIAQLVNKLGGKN